MSRRAFLASSLAAAAWPARAHVAEEAPRAPAAEPPQDLLRFAAVGLNHAHVHGQISALQRGGGTLASFFAEEDDLAAGFARRYPGVPRARSVREVLDDPRIAVVTSASIPDARAPLGLEVMRAGKDFLADKPAVTTLEMLAEVRRVQAETKRIFSVFYSERHESRATVRAGALVAAGAIGRVIQTIGLGPHRLNAPSRPAWFFERARYGGILCDIGSHQLDQFLHFTGSTEAEVVAAQAGNVGHPQYPGLEDFGDTMVRGDGGTGYVRVDWFTPDGLPTWGDGRLTILGTDGFIELRKYVDVAGRAGGDHLFLVDGKETRRFDCREEPLVFGPRLVRDVLDRTETAMTQRHCFLATELALRAQAQAGRVGQGEPHAGGGRPGT